MLTPEQRAKVALEPMPMRHFERWWTERITDAIVAACADSNAALQAALEDLAKVQAERDGLAADLKTANACLAMVDGAKPFVAAHDRKVAARVLRYAETHVIDPVECDTLLYMAGEYERGEREVPGE